MNVLSYINNILKIQKKINIKSLPSQGLFYKDDFELWIKKANIEDIINYEYNYIRDNSFAILNKILHILEKNVILSNNYTTNDIKALDVLYIFIEIVKYTKSEPLIIKYSNVFGEEKHIEFNDKTFNYYVLDENILKNYNKNEKCFEIDGYKYTIPTIGVEMSVNNFIINNAKTEEDILKYNSLNYDFIYFLGHKNSLTDDEIENLIQIFNYDIDDDEKKKIKNVKNIFSPMFRYSLKKYNEIIDLSEKINLETIWR